MYLDGLLGGGPVYTNVLTRATVDADLYVMIESVAADGTVGAVSRTQKLPAGAGAKFKLPLAAWPQRPLPPVASTNWAAEGQLPGGGNLGLSAVRLKRGNANGDANGDYDGIGINIAFFLNPSPKVGFKVDEGRNASLNDEIDPDSLLLQERATTLPLFGQVTG